MATSADKIPPGPTESYATNEDLLEWMSTNCRRFGDIFRARVYGGNVYVLNSSEYVERVLLGNWQNYLRKGQAVTRIALSLGRGLISSNGEFWVDQRRMIQPAFTHESVGAMFTVMQKPSVLLTERWRRAAAEGRSVDVTEDVSLTVLEVTLSALFGSDYAQMAPHFEIVATESRNLEFAQTCVKLTRVIVELIKARRSRHHDSAQDILSTLMRARSREEGKPMPDEQIAREILTLVIAGHETTSSVLNWIWYLLARNTQIDSRLSREITALCAQAPLSFDTLAQFVYSRQVIEEAMRLYPPLWLMTRRAIQPDRLGEYFVPAGTEIYISPFLLQRHPGLWDEPVAFKPERFALEKASSESNLKHCPFGAGPRNCVGEFFARIEMQIHLITVCSVLRLRLDDDKPTEHVAGVNLLSKDHFLMRPELRDAGAISQA